MPRLVAEDETLSLKAKGLYAVLLTIPSHWYCSVNELAAISVESRDAITGALRELEAAGYLERHQMKESGKFAGTEYILTGGGYRDP